MLSEEWKHLLSRFIDNQLDETERDQVEKALESDPEAREYYRQLLALDKKAGEMTLDMDEAFWNEQKEVILEKITAVAEEKIVPVKSRWYARVNYKIVAVAASIALVTFISIFESQLLDHTRTIFGDKTPKVKVTPAPVTVDSAGWRDDASQMSLYEKKKDSEEKGTLSREDITTPNRLADEIPFEEIPPPDKKSERQQELPPATEIIPVDELANEVKAEIPDVKTIEPAEEIPKMDLAGRGGEMPITEKIQPTPKGNPPEPLGDTALSLPSMEAVTKLKWQAEMVRGGGGDSSIPAAGKSVLSGYDYDLANRARTAINTGEQEGLKQGLKSQAGAVVVSHEELDSTLFGDFTPEQKETYLDWRRKAEEVQQKYGMMFLSDRVSGSLTSQSSGLSGQVSISDENLLKIAQTFYELGRITPIGEERTRMIGNLEIIKGRVSADSTINLIKYYLSELRK